MLESLESFCPYCGETVEITVDTSAGSPQEYVEDCPVCCRPWNLRLSCDADGDWIVDLGTEDT